MLFLSLVVIGVLFWGMEASALIPLTGTYNSSSPEYSSGYLFFKNAQGYSLEATRFAESTVFGERGQGSLQDGLRIQIEDGSNLFAKRAYFGSRSGLASNGVGGTVTVDFNGGLNTFVTRVIFGGEGGYDGGTASTDGYLVGRATVNFNDGVTTFERNRDTSSSYYGVYFSAEGQSAFLNAVTSASGGPLTGTYDIACETEGTTVNFAGGSQTTFNTVACFGGAYDLTTYCQVHTSSDDENVVYGGTNFITFDDVATTDFYGRTFFGAAESTTTIKFQGNSDTTFGGQDVFWTSDSAYASYKGYILKDNSEWMAYQGGLFMGDVPNTYKGQDLPYVFFGGSNLTDEDFNTFNFDPEMLKQNSATGKPYRDSATMAHGSDAKATVTLKENAVLNMQTTAFFGGADERDLAGEQYYVKTSGDKTSRFSYGGITSWSGHSEPEKNMKGKSAIRQDTGICDVVLTDNATLQLGVANKNKVLGFNFDMGSGSDPKAYQYIRNRYEQVRLIGASSSFNATGGTLQFDTTKHNQAALDAGNYSHTYLVDELVQGQDYDVLNSASGLAIINSTDTAKTLQLEEATVLDAGMFIFSDLHTSANTGYTLTNIWKLVNMDKKEYYTTTVFVTTGITAANPEGYAEYSDVEINLTAQSIVDPSRGNPLDASDSTNCLSIDKTTYDHLIYTIYIEDVVDESSELGSEVTTRRARLHVVTKSLEEELEGNLKLNIDTIADILENGTDGDPIYDAVTDILDSDTMEEACNSFDDLIGTTYGNVATSQIRQLTTRNMMLANQLNAADPSRECARECEPQCAPEGEVSCGSSNTGNCGSKPCKRNVWASFYGDSDNSSMDNFFSGFESTTYGGMVGMDWNCDDGMLFGGFFSFNETNLNHESRIGGTSVATQAYDIGMYGKWLSLFGGGYTMMIGDVSLSANDSDRSVYGNTFHGDYHGVIPSLYAERGWVFYTDRRLSLNPYGALQIAHYRADAFSETSDATNGTPELGLDVADIEMTSLRTFVGLRFAYDLCQSGKCHTALRANAAWIHELLDESPMFSSTPQYDNPYNPQPWHTISADQLGLDWVNIGIGLDGNFTERLKYAVDYNCYFNEYTTVHTGMATLRFEF